MWLLEGEVDAELHTYEARRLKLQLPVTSGDLNWNIWNGKWKLEVLVPRSLFSQDPGSGIQDHQFVQCAKFVSAVHTCFILHTI